MNEIDPSLILKDGDCIYFHGEKYQKAEPPKSFYDKLWEELGKKVGYGIDCDKLTDRVMDLIRNNIPEPMENKYHSDVLQGYNTAIKEMKERF
jgi:predicted MPP superfamily phosphohydrolase